MKSPPLAFQIGYHDTPYVDVIPTVDCLPEASSVRRNSHEYRHRVVGQSGRSWIAEASILIEPRRIVLAYQDTEWNRSQGMCTGTLVLSLNKSNTRLIGATWTDEGEGCAVKVIANADLPFKPAGKVLRYSGRPRMKEVESREDQDGFRRRVLAAYGFTCAISKCTEPSALEAAHVSPYSQGRNQDPKNGVLLRRDLHAMFDVELLGLDLNGTVHFHPSVSCPTLCGLTKWTTPNDVALQPDKKALKQRWSQFMKRVGKA